MANSKLDILMVEDSSFDRSFVTQELKQCRFDYELHHAGSLEEAAKICSNRICEFDLVLLDLNLPDSFGTRTLREMLQISGFVPIIVLTGDSREVTASEAAEIGAQDYLIKNEDAGGAIRKAITFAVSRQKTTNELKRNIEILAQAAAMDPLTGVSNRRALDEALPGIWRAFCEHKEPCACIMIDLDYFSEINNTYGHQAGDEVLQSVAVTLANKARSKDLVCRYGGEEFCLMLRGSSLRDGWRLAERIRLGIEGDRIRTSHGYLRITASIGVACTTAEMNTPEELLAAADRALYQAKSESRNKVVTTEELPPLESVLSK